MVYSVLSDRVRAICVSMDLTPVLWTHASPQVAFDTGGISLLLDSSFFLDRLTVFQ